MVINLFDAPPWNSKIPKSQNLHLPLIKPELLQIEHYFLVIISFDSYDLIISAVLHELTLTISAVLHEFQPSRGWSSSSTTNVCTSLFTLIQVQHNCFFTPLSFFCCSTFSQEMPIASSSIITCNTFRLQFKEPESSPISTLP